QQRIRDRGGRDRLRLRDGASAQYGSDAVAGVVNIVLRGDEPGGYVTATYGEYYEGDGVSRDIAGWYNLPLGERGFLNTTLHLRNSGTTDRDNPDIRTYFFPGDPREALVDKDFGFYGNPNARSAVGSFNSEYEIAEGVTGYGFGTAAYRKSVSKYMIRPAADNNVRALFPGGRMAQVSYIFRNYDIAGGLKYDAGELGKFDFSLEYGHGRQASSMYNSQNATFGLATPSEFFLGNYNQEQFNAQLDYVREVPVSYASAPLTLSAGVGFRHEEFSIDAGDFASYANGGVAILDGPNAGRRPTPGAADFAGLQPADAGVYDREIFSAYVGLEQQMTDQLQLGAALRFEDYSDFGSTVTGKLSGRFDFTPAIAVRASVSNGFRAPSMGQVGASQTTSLWIQPPTGPQFLGVSAFYPVSNPAARALGAQDLEPEESTNFSAGLVLRPLPGLSVTVDAYRIELDDVILPVDNLTGPAMQSILAGFGLTNISAVRFFANQANVTIEGVDVVARYNWMWNGVGQFGATLGANFNDVSIDSINPNPPALAGTGLVLVGRVSQGYLTQWAPDSKITASLNYASGPFAVDFTAVRYGKYTNTVANPANDQVFGAQWVAKLAVSYSFWDQTKITIGADNLFDSYPDRPFPQNRFNGFNNYDLVAPEGGNGGYYYVSLSKRF
ncbi:MAG: TonB-dependent receptor, partial [Phenylobacterium sp.]|nr:TonB-dependent receptor [Phenylobacterium sp.]